MTLSTQFLTMIAMVLSGVYLGASYYTFKRTAQLWRSSIIWKYVLELLFWLIQAVVIYFVLFWVNEGILRFYIFLAVLCGYAMFKSLFEGLFSRILDVIIGAIKRIYHFIYRTIEILLVKPLVFIVSVVIVCVTKLYQAIVFMLAGIFSILAWPFRMVFSLIEKLLPKNAKKYLHPFYKIYSKIKNKD
ncbi:spore cortex biosynthesis protein YabQ [Gracilibacillus caseinilyticus]|uniref:Spore cortex biosynthesis protein YabQ n=1 Tax=Gracilibacillus caseinilyticus TaxID=2932256 RepID=A0ABY4F010_9BACI|nr:spore cortex biosynthesis protein YabQ [Gracilibacillus caseinilyticus]UOQ49512.1 spore cortex biosynthesis protein YabQ [Gracilibacillus caseinilyticus]